MVMSDHTFLQALKTLPLVAILRGLTPEATAEKARELWDAGVSLVEVPLHSTHSEAAFAEALAVKRPDNGEFLGIGSVRDEADLALALRLKANFTVAPNCSPAVIREATAAGVPHLPGVATPTEIATALSEGASLLKLFPASLYGPRGVRAVLDPFPDARLIAVGGVTLDNAREYLEAGAIAVGIGSGLASPAPLSSGAFASLR